MRRDLAPIAALCAALALAGPAAALDVGVTEDEGKQDPGLVYSTLEDAGMTTNVMSIRWNPLDPLALPPDFDAVQGAVEVAAAHGVSVILATYQDVNTGITDTPEAPAAFAAWLGKVAEACPLCVRKLIVLNEPNLQYFWKPTFDPGCHPSSPAEYARVLAAAYDGLKTIDPAIRVYGVGLSPRGNDNCRAVSNVSMSPVAFLGALGEAYRAMNRDLPLMDALSFHPYPNLNNQGPDVGYRWPNVGVPNLDRLKQAFYDAFAGTAQPVIGFANEVRTTGAVLPPMTIALDELGWQVFTDDIEAYDKGENVPIVSEHEQAEWYADAIARFACDPAVETLNFFHLRDEPDRRRFQSGLLRLDGSRRPAYDAVEQAIAESKRCSGRRVSWRPAKGVVGARVFWSPVREFPRPESRFGFRLTADEGATYAAALIRVESAGAAASQPVETLEGDVRAYFRPYVGFQGPLEPGLYRFEVTVAAAFNAARTTTFRSPVFAVR